MKTYPICLINLEKQRVVVIGGGGVAARKAASLVEAGARPLVVSPEMAPELRGLAELGTVELIERGYQPGDLRGAFLVVAATDQPEVNAAVWEEARQAGCLINVVDVPQQSNFIVPAVVRRGEMLLAISTGGASPALARRLRERLEGEFDEAYATLAEIMAELRPELLRCHAPGEPRLQAALRLVDSDILQVIRTYGQDAARDYALEQIRGECSQSLRPQ